MKAREIYNSAITLTGIRQHELPVEDFLTILNNAILSVVNQIDTAGITELRSELQAGTEYIIAPAGTVEVVAVKWNGKHLKRTDYFFSDANGTGTPAFWATVMQGGEQLIYIKPAPDTTGELAVILKQTQTITNLNDTINLQEGLKPVLTDRVCADILAKTNNLVLAQRFENSYFIKVNEENKKTGGLPRVTDSVYVRRVFYEGG